MEYSGIAGDPQFVDCALKFGYGEDSAPLQDKRIQGVQALSGTGGLRVMGELLRRHGHTHIYVPNPTWGNHIPIFTNAGLEVRKYRYYDAASSDLDFDGMIKDISEMPEGSTILLHACAHNVSFLTKSDANDVVNRPSTLSFHAIVPACHMSLTF
jgi:aspartate aminotransferase